MKAVLVNGNRLDMDDRVADLVVDFALALSDRGMHAAITVPTRLNGLETQATMSLGCPTVWVLVDMPDSQPEMRRSSEAADEIEARLSAVVHRRAHQPASQATEAFDWWDLG